MKKIWLLTVVLLATMIAGCTNNEQPVVVPNDGWNTVSHIESNSDFFGNRKNSKSRAVAIQKPSLDQMENFDAIVNWYKQDWTMNYELTEEDVKTFESCLSYPYSNWTVYVEWCIRNSRFSNTLKASDFEFKPWTVIQLTWTHNFSYHKVNLSDEDKAVLSDRWWTILPINKIDNYDSFILNYNEEYAEEPVNGRYNNLEEWNKLYEIIWWIEWESERSPANTVLITNDLLLHSFHKLFDNTLKYYEQTVSRDTIKELSQTLFDKFIGLHKLTSYTPLSETYEFLAAYRSIPASILVSTDELKVEINVDEYWYPTNTSLSDEDMQKIIKKNSEKYFSQLSPAYQKLMNTVLDQIFAAKETVADNFLMSYSPDFIVLNDIKQDYTQFVPRSHYTDNPELKTYFMAMKWLMREKFYFGDNKLLNAALVMVSNISDEDTAKLTELSEKIKKLVWWDDDLTLESLSSWMKNNKLDSIAWVEITEEQKAELFNLVPQKIQSTAYSTDSVMEISSDEAKDMTAWFVFFGEKFTLDSYLFDLVTAGSAEKEFAYMPNKQTALIVPDILENNSDAAEIVNLWMNARIAKWDILEDSEHTQYSSYNNVKQEAQQKLDKELSETSIMNTTYHKWINMLWYLINEVEENAPYFKLDPVYRLKNLITYMWSYTELKHDTLLYVKQSYAEMWWGGGGCGIEVNPPALPVPKWYIEADIDVIDRLIELNNETKSDFSEMPDFVIANFDEFDIFLVHMKSILEQQMKNEVISDNDFERMRTAHDELAKITFPLWSNVSQKEMRAALIADIFTSEWGNPLYEAVGRPAIMLVMIDDINGKRIARGPVFTHYEFYDSDNVIDAWWSRLNDLQWQAAYDGLTWDKLKSAFSTLSKSLQKWLKVQE